MSRTSDRDHRSRDRISHLTFPWIELTTNTETTTPIPWSSHTLTRKERGRNQHQPLAFEVPFFIRNRGSIASASVPLGRRTNSHTSRGPDPDDETVLGPGQFDLRHFESEPTDRGRVLKRCDVGRVLRGPRGALHLAGYCCFMMDETGDYACGNQHASSRRASVWVLVNGATWTWVCGCERCPALCVGSSDNLVISRFFVNHPRDTRGMSRENRFEAAFHIVGCARQEFENFSSAPRSTILRFACEIELWKFFPSPSQLKSWMEERTGRKVSRFLFSFPFRVISGE